MGKNEANNPSETEFTEQVNSTTDEQAGKQKSPDTMTAEELRKEIISTQTSEPRKETEVENESEETPEEGEIPDDLKDKSQAELVKILVNLRKLKGRQDQELGELRKFKKQQEELQAQMEEQNLSSSAQKMVSAQVKGMTPEERTAFYDKFAEDPEAALLPLIQKAMHPILIQQAKQNNETVVKRLKESTKDSLVPYDEEGVNKIIASYQKGNRNELFDRYGSDAFQVAYDIYFKQNINSAVEKHLAEEKEKMAKEVKTNPYVESQGVSAGKNTKPTDYEKMSFEELRKLVGGTKL